MLSIPYEVSNSLTSHQRICSQRIILCGLYANMFAGLDFLKMLAMVEIDDAGVLCRIFAICVPTTYSTEDYIQIYFLNSLIFSFLFFFVFLFFSSC
jgi:hypothetical protein